VLRSLKEALDPNGILAPGRYVSGATSQTATTARLSRPVSA
jgi:hypothetical protein